MTQAALEAAVNALLPSGLPITAAGQHRPSMQQIINELYAAQSRGDVMKDVQTTVSLNAADKVFLIRSGQAYLVDKAVFSGIDGGTP